MSRVTELQIILLWSADCGNRLNAQGVLPLSRTEKEKKEKEKTRLHEQQLPPLKMICKPASFFHSSKSNPLLQVNPCSENVAPCWSLCAILSLQSKDFTDCEALSKGFSTMLAQRLS